MPTLTYERQTYQHHCDGGEQSRTVELTVFYRSIAITYSSPWRKR